MSKAVATDIKVCQRPIVGVSRYWEIGRRYLCTYVHLGRKAASSIMVPDLPRPFLLKSASVMVASMVINLLSYSPTLKISFDIVSISVISLIALARAIIPAISVV
jgi:hypothetical protein